MSRFYGYEYERMVNDTYVKLVYNAEEMEEYLINKRDKSVIILCQPGDVDIDDKIDVYGKHGLKYENSVILDIHDASINILDTVAKLAYQLWNCLLQSISMENAINNGRELIPDEVETCNVIEKHISDIDNVKYFDTNIIENIKEIIKYISGSISETDI